MPQPSLYYSIRLVFVCAVLGFAACKREGGDDKGKGADAKPAAEVKIPVEVALASRQSISANFQGTAALEAEAVAQVVAKTGGVILQILVEERQTELFNRKLIGSGVFEQLKFDLETQKASYDIAALELSYTEIRAPISGTLSQRLVKLGNQINSGQTLFRIDDFDPLEARVAVPERDMQAIKAGQPVQMLVDAMPGTVFMGTLGHVWSRQYCNVDP